MSKAIKQIVSVAAMIAIPYFAPLIGGSAALAGISATIGTTATSALVGAGLGAIKGAVLGEDVGRSALMGGLSGGVAGYLEPAAAGVAAGPQTTVDAYGQIVPSSVNPAAAGLSTATAPAAGLQTTVNEFGQIVPSSVDPAAGLGGVPQMGQMGPQTAQQLGAGFNQQMTAAGVSSRPATFMDALSQVPREIAAKFNDPKNLADMTLRAAGMLAGSALAGSGLSSEEEALLGQQTEELRQLQKTNQALFNQRLEQAQNLAGESKYFDPEYFGLQSARRAQTAGAVAKSAGLRGMTGERRASEGRRYDIESGRRTGTAYDTGYQSAISPRLQTQQAGLAQMPTSGPSVNYSGLQTAYTNAATQRRNTQKDIGDLFGSLTSNPRSRG